MEKPTGARKIMWAGSHLLAVLAGWGLWTVAGDRVLSAATESREFLKFRSHERVARMPGERAEEILDRISASGKNQLPAKMKRVDAYKLRLLAAEELKKRAAGMEVAGDPAAAAKEKLETFHARLKNGGPEDLDELAEMEVRLLHWMDADPQAALAWFGAKSREDLAEVVPYLRNSLDVMIPGVGVEEAGKWIGVNSRLDAELTRSIADHAGAAADLGQLARLKAGIDPQQWNNIRLSLIDTWPLAKADDLFSLAQTESAPLTVLLYARHQGKEGMAWLQRHLAAAGTDPAFQSSLLRHHDYHQLMYLSPDYDFEKRAEVVAGFEPGKPAEQIRLELGSRDVVSALDGGRDWRFAFRNGTATAEEIYREMAKALPDLAAKSPEALKLQLFKELSEFGGPQATSLLDHLPAEKKWEMVMKAPQWQFLNGNPQDFHDFIRTIPADTGNPEVWETRLRVWEDKTRRYREKLGAEQYDQWVGTLPDGIDREMASFALVKQMRNGKPELKERLISQIKDPQLKQRMEGAQ
ncbi:hypothetical protein OVA24_14150 [Luteolibacter sp. SL250]|uniref:hypothetical protein n=1 Tax=Luteolibacter sp. SL250 TaxID=2995170 RepID=UPI00226F7B55|nr:hypothetical protein [Luteolibacter sp. SL250]WAC18376.1 hypothetical protein OVA24_14150 [Luteolibacter sp. SL250]